MDHDLLNSDGRVKAVAILEDRILNTYVS